MVGDVRAKRWAGVLAVGIVVTLSGCGGDDGPDQLAATKSWVGDMCVAVAEVKAPGGVDGSAAVAVLDQRLGRVAQAFGEDPRELARGAELNVERGLDALDTLRSRVQVLESALRDAEKDPDLASVAEVRNQAAQVVAWAEATLVPLDLRPGDELGDLLGDDQRCGALEQMVDALADPPSL